MFHAKYLSSSSYGFLKEDILSFFLSVAMATRVLLGIKFFEQLLKLTTKEHSCTVWVKLA
jgi:hypothetical protein